MTCGMTILRELERKGEIRLFPIHNHLSTELCTEKCPNFRASKSEICEFCGRIKTPKHKTVRKESKQTLAKKDHSIKVICTDMLDSETKVTYIKELTP